MVLASLTPVIPTTATAYSGVSDFKFVRGSLDEVANALAIFQSEIFVYLPPPSQYHHCLFITSFSLLYSRFGLFYEHS